MAIQATTAAQAIETTQGEMSSHRLISLLMAGGLERIEQAKASIEAGNSEDTAILVSKLVGIINGLRSSLNFDAGGEIAVNLDNLYDYMINRIGDSEENEQLGAMSEVSSLLTEVKDGWDEMNVEVPEIEAR